MTQALLDKANLTATEYAVILGVEPSTVTRRCLLKAGHPLHIHAQKGPKEWAIPMTEIERLEQLREARKQAATLGGALAVRANALWRLRAREWAEQMHAAQVEAARHTAGGVAWSRATEQIGALWEQRREWQAVRALELALLREAHVPEEAPADG